MMISVRSSQFTRRSRHFAIIQNQIILVRYINIQIPFFFQSASYYLQIVFSIVSFSGREKAQIKITRIVINRATCNKLNQKKAGCLKWHTSKWLPPHLLRYFISHLRYFSSPHRYHFQPNTPYSIRAKDFDVVRRQRSDNFSKLKERDAC